MSANRRIESALSSRWRRMISPSVVGWSATMPGYARARSAHVLIVGPEDEDALGRYLDHPLRAGYVADHLQQLEADRISVPFDKSLLRDPRVSGNGAGALEWALRSSSERRESAARPATYLRRSRAAVT